MGSLFRSEPMQLVQLFVQVEAAPDTIDELGKLGLIQFRDLNPTVSAFQRNFVNQIKRCDDMERKLRFFETQYEEEKKAILLEQGKPEDTIVELESVEGDYKRIHMDELEVRLSSFLFQSQFEEQEKELQQLNSNQEMLSRNFNELVELRYVLTKDSAFFSEAERENAPVMEEQVGLLGPESNFAKTVKLGFVTGVIPRASFPTFERVLWRSTRGNLFMKHAEIEEPILDPTKNELVEKNVFIIFFQGERSQMKIKKICESFKANLYPCHDNAKERREFLEQVNGRLEDLQKVLKGSKKHRRTVLFDIGKQLPLWKEKLLKEKSIYHTMNLFNYDVGRKCLIAEGWCPKTSTEKIVDALRRATESSGALVPSILSVIQSSDEPPTHFQTNKFTRVFQSIVDAYGIPRYREVNPGVFTIVTFPFLFAVMFGDFGHGFLMALFAGYMVLNEKKLGAGKLNEMLETCFNGRYIILLMGLFSMYTGLLYNECFSVALDLCGSNWALPAGVTNGTVEAHLVNPHRTYEFGVDPAWNGAVNSITYYNSLKMKMSIIFGVSQMVLGIFMSLLNGLYFREAVDIFGEFVPQMIFMLSLFGYLVFLIFFKWSFAWTTQAPPFLLNVMIQMFLSPLSLKEENKLFSGQWVLLISALVAVPWMLLTKPFVLKSRHKNQLLQAPGSLMPEEGEEDKEEEFDFSEIFVKQCIHTIEYVLGAISNTASYLRLWALSLAHSELSIVFWERIFIFLYSMKEESAVLQPILVFCAFSGWAAATFGVLLVMESLSAFLHALRLHWVEFQNKFYHGDGILFVPFSYELIMQGSEGND